MLHFLRSKAGNGGNGQGRKKGSELALQISFPPPGVLLGKKRAIYPKRAINKRENGLPGPPKPRSSAPNEHVSLFCDQNSPLLIPSPFLSFLPKADVVRAGRQVEWERGDSGEQNNFLSRLLRRLETPPSKRQTQGWWLTNRNEEEEEEEERRKRHENPVTV